MPTPATNMLRWELLRGSGWQFLLPPTEGRRLICYDCLGGATTLLLAELADELWVIHHDEEELARLQAKARLAGLGGVRFAFLSPEGRSDAPGAFDGLVVHDPLAAVLRRNAGRAPALGLLCAAAARHLRPGGFLYLGLRNRFAYTRLRRDGPRELVPPRLLSVGGVLRTLRRSGFYPRRPFPLVLEGSRLLEVVPEGGYRSAKNRFLPAERLRELTLGAWGAQHLAPAYALVAFRGASQPSRIERLLADPWIQALCPQATLRRYLVLNEGKVALSLAPPTSRHGTLIVVLSPDPRAAERRRREARLLTDLARLRPEIARSIPVFHGETLLQGVTAFAMGELAGITVDRDAPFLPELTQAAVRWLIGFNLATSAPTDITDEAFARLFGVFFERARAENPPLTAELSQLEESLCDVVAGRRLPSVWLHGDFKVENIVFDEESRALRGVIDWELSSPAGLPMLDLLYLLIYNRVIRDGVSLLTAVRSTILASGWGVQERVLLDQYYACFPGTRPLEAVLAAMFFVHHIGVRFRYDLGREDIVTNLRAIIAALRERLPPASPSLE